MQHALGWPREQLSEMIGALVLSAKAVIVHWEKSEPSTKKSDWKVVALALTTMKPPSPAVHAS